MPQGMKELSKARQLLIILSAQSVSTYANQVIALVVPWLILSRTGNAASAGTIAFVMGIAALAGSLTGGLVTDRIGGRRVSILADGLSLITALTLAAALWLDLFSLWLVAITQVLGIFFDGPGHIAKISIVPAAAKEEGVPITRAMGLTQTLQGVATFVGPITAGLLIAAFGEANTLVVATILFLMSIVLASRLRKQVRTHEQPMSARQAYRDMREAVQFLIREPFLGKMQLVGPLMGAVIVPVSALVFRHGSSSLSRIPRRSVSSWVRARSVAWSAASCLPRWHRNWRNGPGSSARLCCTPWLCWSCTSCSLVRYWRSA